MNADTPRREDLQLGREIVGRINELAAISEDPARLTRLFLTAEHRAANSALPKNLSAHTPRREDIHIARESSGRNNERAPISQDPPPLTHLYLTAEHRAAPELIRDTVRQAGMSAHMDPIGNVHGR